MSLQQIQSQPSHQPPLSTQQSYPPSSPNRQPVRQITNHYSTSKDKIINQKCCKQCGIHQNEIRHQMEAMIVEIEGNNGQEMYCDSCLQSVLLKEQIQLRKLQEKYIYQKQFESSLTQSDMRLFNTHKGFDSDHLIRQVQELEDRQKEIHYLLEKASTESNQLQQKVYLLQQREEKFWLGMNKLQKRALKLEQKAFLANSQGQVEKRTFENFSKTCIVQIFFKIDIQDSYAKIYGLPIGKKPEQIQMNWQQVNTGLGHLLLAYNYLIIKYGLTYTNIEEIKIKGHLSQIKLKHVPQYIPVGYGVNTGSNVGADKKFGIVMDSLLSEMAYLAQHIQEIQNIQYFEELKLPYNIDKKQGKIVDLYVNPTKLQEKGKWSQWTKAMRYFLIDVKHLLTVVSLGDPYL